MGKGSNFFGQPPQCKQKVDETPQNHRFHHDYIILQRDI